MEGDQPFAVPAVVFSGFFRIVTHSRIFNPPSKFKDALVFADQVRSLDHCITVVPNARHWDIFVEIAQKGGATGSLVSDAYLAAMAIEIGAELITDDRGLGRWPGLRWRRPVDE